MYITATYVYQIAVLPCSVVWRPCDFFCHTTSTSVSKNMEIPTTHPLHPTSPLLPYVQHSWYFVPHLNNLYKANKSNWQAIVWLFTGSYIYIYIVNCCAFSANPMHMATVKHKEVMWYWIFQIYISQNICINVHINLTYTYIRLYVHMYIYTYLEYYFA